MSLDAVEAIRREAAARAAETPELSSTAQQALTPRGGTAALPVAEPGAAPPVADVYALPESRPAIDPERQRAIDAYVAENATATETGFLWSTNHVGGDRIAEAMAGESQELGAMTQAERRHMAAAAIEVWRDGGDYTLFDHANTVMARRNDPAVTRDMAFELARSVAGADRSGPIEGRDAVLLNIAFGLQPSAGSARPIAEAFAGQEAALADFLSGPDFHSTLQRQAVWSVLADRHALPPDQAERLTTALFLYETAGAVTPGVIAEALANVRRPGDSAADTAARDLMARNIETALSRSGGNQLLFGAEIDPGLRVWALDQIAGADRALTRDELSGGWESAFISRQYAQAATAQYQARGTDPQVLNGEALRNTVGMALGLTPDQLPAELSEDWLATGLDNQMFGENDMLDAVADRIASIGDEVTIVPVTLTSEREGAAVVPVFRVVDRETGDVRFVDHRGDRYRDFEHWQEDNTLPSGRMTYAEGLDLASDRLTHENTPGVIDSFSEYFGAGLQAVAIGASLVGAGMLIVGSGGTATPLVLMAGGGVIMAGSDALALQDMAARGRDITDLSDPEVRSRVLGVAAGALSVGAIAGATRVAALGSRATPLMTRGVAALQMTAEGADAIAMADQAYQMVQGWDQMSAGQRAMGLLEVAFWGGMALASVRASGAQAHDGLSFTRLERQLRTGTPIEMSVSPELATGQMRVAYDLRNGRAQDIRIEVGPGDIDPAALQRHTGVARQMEFAGGLTDRLRAMLGAESAPVGSAAWEARLEIDKINAEAADIAAQLGDPSLSASDARALELRQTELQDAISAQSARLDQLETLGAGWVAAPHRGADQATALGYPDAPDGYTWVAGSDGTPHLRDLTGEGNPLRFDTETRLFVPREGAVPTRTVGNGTGQENTASWRTDDQGRLIEVTATLNQYQVGAGRSAAELAAQAQARAQGLDGDDAGHAIGHRFLQDQGLQNLIPQNANLNRGAYKTLENELADWIAAGGQVEIRVRPDDYVDGRPGVFEVRYDVFDANGNRVHNRDVEFDNGVGQTFDRVDRDHIERTMGNGSNSASSNQRPVNQ